MLRYTNPLPRKTAKVALIIHSRDDAVHPLPEARKMAGGIPNAEFAVLESANQNVLPEEPTWQAQVITLFEFIERP